MLTTNHTPQTYLGGLVSPQLPADHPVQVCIHGHFYQPPRENPFTGEVPPEGGAEPYANFNQKITAECYRPNAQAGNFERISFNLGPTLATWIEQNDPETHQRMVESDQLNYNQYGYGNALAQNYNHVILPLATPADARLQIKWGIMDFERRFGHAPEGMWLAETGASTWVLDLLAQAGLKFVILAPWQADQATVETINPARRAVLQSQLRQHIVDGWKAQAQQLPPAEASQWLLQRVNSLPVQLPEPYDVSEPYQVELSEGRSMVVFFYNGKLSGDISFNQEATADGDRYAQQWLLPEINQVKFEQREPQLLLIATDGELYGHHQPYRDHFLKHLTLFAIPGQGMTLTFPSRYMREHPPRRRIRIHDNSSWSCHHGVERWSRGCGCTPGDSSWKNILRQACDWLAGQVDQLYAQQAPVFFNDPTSALDDFLWVWQGHQTAQSFMQTHLQKGQSSRQALNLLQAQAYKHQMYTSCAWFFEDIDRIEPKNAMAAAAIIFRLLNRWLPAGSRRTFEDILAHTTSQHTGLSGATLYRSGVRWAARHARNTAAPADPTNPPTLLNTDTNQTEAVA